MLLARSRWGYRRWLQFSGEGKGSTWKFDAACEGKSNKVDCCVPCWQVHWWLPALPCFKIKTKKMSKCFNHRWRLWLVWWCEKNGTVLFSSQRFECKRICISGIWVCVLEQIETLHHRTIEIKIGTRSRVFSMNKQFVLLDGGVEFVAFDYRI